MHHLPQALTTETMFGRRKFKGRPKRRFPARRRGSSKKRQAAVFKRRVLRIVGAESKFRITGANSRPQIGAQTEIRLTDIDVGTSASQRIGNWIRPVSLRGNMVIRGTAGNALQKLSIRVGVALWKNDQSADPFLAGDIMADGNSPFGEFSVLEKGSFQILWTRTMVVVNNDDNSQNVKKVMFSINLSKVLKTLYSGAAPKKYQLFYFFISDDSNGGADAVNIEVDALFRYTDG